MSIATNTLRLSAIALLAMTVGLQAQDDTTAAEAEADPAAEESGLSMGEPEGPQVGDTYISGEFSDWELRCVKAEDGNDPCQLYQLLRDAAGTSVAEVNFFPLPSGGQAVAGANIITPLETLLTEQIRFSVDGGSVRRYPFSFCAQVGCISRLGFTGPEVDQMKAGISGKVTIVPAAAPDNTVDLTMSLAGFTAGLAALQATLPQ